MRRLLCLLTLSFTLTPTAAQHCEATWGSPYPSGGLSGSYCRVILQSDGPDDSAVYAGGNFSMAGGLPARNVARWNGEHWSALGKGLNKDVYALSIFDDGGGNRLYAAGRFQNSGEVDARHIASWDGQAWTETGGGLSHDALALAIFDDGSGEALYVGGLFFKAGGAEALHVARWDGSQWAAVSGGTDDAVLALFVFDDGDGPALYAGGRFRHAGGIAASRIARWDGHNWSALGAGVDSEVLAMGSFDDGDGPALYVGGSFRNAGGEPAVGMAKWDAPAWVPLGQGVGLGGSDFVKSIRAYNDGSGAKLIVGGDFDTAGGQPIANTAAWDGGSWSRVGPDLGIVRCLTEVTEDGKTHLWAATDSAEVWNGTGYTSVDHVAALAPNAWVPLGAGADSLVAGVLNMPDGRLLAYGGFSWVGGTFANCIAAKGQDGWTPLGGGLGMQNSVGLVRVAALFDEGQGPTLFVGGNFDLADGQTARHVARWDGQAWSPVGDGINSEVLDLQVFDDGTGSALYAGGPFSFADGQQTWGVARWDGETWTPLGKGLMGSVNDLTVFDDGTGPSLYAFGSFQAPDHPDSRHASRWDGTNWSPLGKGLGDHHPLEAFSAAVFDDGSGPVLYVGGSFQRAGDVAASTVAQWDGTEWSAVPGLGGTAHAMAVFDDGRGPALYAAGECGFEGEVEVSRVMKWDGATWTATTDPIVTYYGPAVWDLRALDDGGRHVLAATGSFRGLGGVSAGGIAELGCDTPTCYADLDRDGTLDLFDFLAFVNAFNAGAGDADCDQTGGLDLFDFLCFVNAFNEGC